MKFKNIRNGYVTFCPQGFFTSVVFVTCLFFFVRCSDDDNLGEENLFPPLIDTLFDADTSALKFFVISDWGFNGSSNQKKVAAGMADLARLTFPKFIVTCGDNFQIDKIKTINDPFWETNYRDVYSDSSLLIPWYPALGNHDYFGNPTAEVEYSTIYNYWKMPARFYSFTKQVDSITFARFIVLDTPALVAEYDKLDDKSKFDSISQYRWLKEILMETKEKWVFVIGHHPIYSASKFHGDTPEIKAMVKPLLDQYNVDFYICGHDHDFEHARDTSSDLDYIVTGTAASLRASGHNSRTVFSVSVLGFSYFSVTRGEACLRFITSEGRLAYTYKKKK
jgi:tartrate-resistant acid phosphatase type 5